MYEPLVVGFPEAVKQIRRAAWADRAHSNGPTLCVPDCCTGISRESSAGTLRGRA